jgi:hypothetical protein
MPVIKAGGPGGGGLAVSRLNPGSGIYGTDVKTVLSPTVSTLQYSDISKVPIWNASDKGAGVSITGGGGLTVTNTGSDGTNDVRATLPASDSTNAYCEYLVNSIDKVKTANASGVGLANLSASISSDFGVSDFNGCQYIDDGRTTTGSIPGIVTGLATFTNGDYVGILLNATQIKAYKNGVLVYTWTSIPTGTLYPVADLGNISDSFTANFGATPMHYLPSGAKSWDGSQIQNNVGAAAGADTTVAVGASLFNGVGAATGADTTVATGSSLFAAVGSSAGSGTVVATGANLFAGAGSTAGSATVTATGASLFNGIGSAVGTGAASGIGASTAAGVGSAAGSGAATAIGSSIANSVGSSAGSATVTATGASLAAAVGSSVGSATVTGFYGATGAGAGSSAGTGSAVAEGQSLFSAVGSSAGSALVQGEAPAVEAQDFSDDFSLDFSGGFFAEGVTAGASHGSAAVTGVGSSIAPYDFSSDFSADFAALPATATHDFSADFGPDFATVFQGAIVSATGAAFGTTIIGATGVAFIGYPAEEPPPVVVEPGKAVNDVTLTRRVQPPVANRIYLTAPEMRRSRASTMKRVNQSGVSLSRVQPKLMKRVYK